MQEPGDDLYAQCFGEDGKQRKKKELSPKEAFARVLKQILEFDIELRTGLSRLEKSKQRGYVFAAREAESNHVFIGFGGHTTLSSAMKRLQAGNPRQLEVMCVLRRDDIGDAQLICEHMHRGMMMWRVRGMWYEIEDCNKISAMFARIDRLDSA